MRRACSGAVRARSRNAGTWRTEWFRAVNVASTRNAGGCNSGFGEARRSIFSVTSKDHENIYMTLRSEEVKLTLQDLIDFGKDADKNTVLHSAMWMQKDLPVRMGHRVKVLQLPHTCRLHT